MSEPVAVARQATFNTEPADSVSGGSIRRGTIELPVVDSTTQETSSKTDKNNNDKALNGDNHDGVDNDITDSDNELHPLDNGQNDRGNNNSNQSSPIYGSKSAYEKFTKRYAPRAIKSSSIYDDSSDLEILSDVGLADDSDCDVKPVITPLSLSARRKTRKAPRIKVPSAKVDNEEPTIQEETTQDILNIQTQEGTAVNLARANRIGRQIRSQTVVYEKRLETVSDEIVVIESDACAVISADQKRTSKTPSKVVSKEEKRKPSEPLGVSEVQEKGSPSKIKAKDNSAYTKDNKDFRLLKDELESSFCESDWQPHETSKTLILEESDQRETFKKGDRNSRHEQDPNSEPQTAREQKSTPLQSQAAKRPRSAGDRPKSKKSSSQNVESRLHNGSEAISETVLPSETKVESRPQSRSVPTPLISNYLEKDGEKLSEDQGTKTEKNPSQYSGVPRRASGKTRARDSTVPNHPSKHHLQPPRTSGTKDNMETSDGYDYESETFEEILKDRNAMVKAERTYQKRIKQLEDELKGMINQCQALSDENKELRRTIDGLKKAAKNETKQEDDQSTIELTSRIARLETEKENLVKTNEKLSQAAKDESKNKQSEVVFVENTKLKNKNSELEKKVRSVQGEVERLQAKVQELSTNNSGNSAVLEFKNKELEVAVGELRYENKSLHSRIKTLENEKHLITNSLEEKRIEINEMMRAMQNETVTESELKFSKVRLEEAQGEINSVRSELEEMKQMLHKSESKKSKLQNTVLQRETEIKRLRGEHENKEKIIVELRSTAEKFRDEVARHEENRQIYKDMERETAALKSRIGSLKTEIESSLSENQKLKLEREEANQEIDRLRHESTATADAMAESRRYFRKWEVERESRNKAEVELAKRQDEIDSLQVGLKESGVKMNMLYGRLRAAEDDREKYRGPNAEELETNNKILKDENKKLRQMLIEKNVELVNKTNEKEVLDNRVGILERKQKDAESRVRQLSGWVDSINSSQDIRQPQNNQNNKQSTDAKIPPRPSLANSNKNQTHVSSHAFKPSPVKRTGVKEPIIAVISPRSRKKRTTNTMTPPPSWDEKADRYQEDGPNHTPLSLPLISESKPRTPTDFNTGYFQMYKERMKRVKDRQYAFE